MLPNKNCWRFFLASARAIKWVGLANRWLRSVELTALSFLLLSSVAVTCCLASSYNINACTYTDDSGKVYDLSPLVPKNDSGYMWTQTVYDTTGNLLTNPDFSNPVKVTMQVHVCRNITKAMSTNCSSKGLAPVYMNDGSTGMCYAYGNIRTANIQPNPLKDGVFIDYYGGEAVNNIAQYSARLYFVCKTGTKLDGPHLEHVKDSYTAHIRFNTEYVC